MQMIFLSKISFLNLQSHGKRSKMRVFSYVNARLCNYVVGPLVCRFGNNKHNNNHNNKSKKKHNTAIYTVLLVCLLPMPQYRKNFFGLKIAF